MNAVHSQPSDNEREVLDRPRFTDCNIQFTGFTKAPEWSREDITEKGQSVNNSSKTFDTNQPWQWLQDSKDLADKFENLQLPPDHVSIVFIRILYIFESSTTILMN